MVYGAISIDSGTLHGKPVFDGTQVPIQAFFEYLEEGKSMEKFLDDYPAVNKKDTIEVLQMAKLLLSTEKIIKENFSGK